MLIGLNNAVGGELTNGFNVPGLDSQKAYDLLVEEFPQQGGISANVVVKAPRGRNFKRRHTTERHPKSFRRFA